MPRSSPQRTAARRVDLLSAAADIVRESGFGAASVKAITSRAGTSAGLLYTYADSVDDVLAQVFREYAGSELAAVDEAVHSTEQHPVAQLVGFVETFASRALRGRRLAWALLVEPVGHRVESERLLYRRGYVDLMADIIRQGIAAEAFADQDPDITAAGLVGAIGEALTGPLSPVGGDSASTPSTGPVSDTEVVRAIVDLCLRAVGATDRRGTFDRDGAAQ